MKALLLKDFYVVTKNMKVLIILMLFMTLVNEPTFLMISAIYGSMFPMTALAYDERSYFNKLAKVFPYSAFSITVSKYLFGYICLALSLVFTLTVQMLFYGEFSSMIIVLGIIFGTCCMAFSLPPMFKYGSAKGRLVFIFLVMLCTIGTNFMNTYEFGLNVLNNSYALMFLFVVIINILSILISLKINTKKGNND